jgi:hypothetical protein|nr:MAG TPA: hypothetical protein [Caudoviricetes sp.]
MDENKVISPHDEPKIICKKCGRERAATKFFKKKTKERIDICVDCLTMYIDNYDYTTFSWILEMFDIPYIKNVWIKMANDIYLKNPAKFSNRSVIGKYIRTMNMKQYADYCFADSDKLNMAQEMAKERREATVDKDYVLQLQKELEEGKISKAQYDTLSPETPSSIDKEEEEFIALKEEAIKPIQQGADEGEIRKQLTDEEYQYLLMKWGYLYQPSQLVQMEKLYNKYANEYELNVDREDTLKKICKTSLKMDEALDVGDTQSYQKLASVYDQLRKAGKFTEVQNKEEQERYLDSVGELVALCEREGGPIKEFIDPDEYPQDKVDFTIKDLKSYNYNLATNELNLSDLIQTYIDKLDKAEQSGNDIDLNKGLITSKEEEAEEDTLSDQEAIDFQDYLDNEIERDAQMLLDSFGGDI